MSEFITKHLVSGAFLGIVAFIGTLFVTLLFLLLGKIKDYYEEKRLYRHNHGKEKGRKNDGDKQQ